MQAGCEPGFSAAKLNIYIYMPLEVGTLLCFWNFGKIIEVSKFDLLEIRRNEGFSLQF